ncbi:hypothetical protein F2P81_016965 [Scophthalmus maximus]|uniref:Thyroglobulin type-1 domain-containing protein n=1 Tax=Scophthalmus maximus TaxID=52904 RepID=A0A6A4SH27_SCOMX|nr:hypothetical protein F2P81_016965 [Scophthalmus maximus]
MPGLPATCQALLVFLLSGSVLGDRTAPFLITENMWPRGCVLDCQRGRHRAVCGSNGRLYKSLCAFQRAQCINTHLRLAPRAHCSDLSQSKCQLARAQALEANGRSEGSHASPAAAMFVPECHPDGHFLPVQCHNQTGYCWCSTPDGKPLSGTSMLHLIPSCADEVGEPGPTLDPRKPAGDKRVLLPADGSSDLGDHPDELGQTTHRNRIPDCTGAEEDPDRIDRRYRDKPLPGCPGARKEQFLQSLVRALQLEAKHAGSLSPYQTGGLNLIKLQTLRNTRTGATEMGLGASGDINLSSCVDDACRGVNTNPLKVT